MELSELVPLDPDHVDYVDYGDDGADAHCADYTYYENLFMEGTLDYDAGDCPSLEHDDADRVKHDYHLDVSLVDEETEVLDFDDGAFLDLDDLSQLVDDLTYELVNITAPDWYLNPEFRVLFAERSTYDSIAGCSPLTFAPTLHDALTSPEPPSIDWFKALPIYNDDKI
jgi:hypothetical protein